MKILYSLDVSITETYQYHSIYKNNLIAGEDFKS